MEISAALIVKNEEDCLPRCLQSLDGAVDEIVVVDTGSTDRTKSIAAQFTDRLYDFTWTDDFAAARNFAVQNATGDYVLSIDADEAIINTSDAARLLRTFIQQHPSHTLGTVAVRSVINLGEGMENVDAIQRFFNRHQFRYEGRIHEQLAPSGGGATVAPTGVHILHTGYDHSAAPFREKANRNLHLLNLELESCPDDEYFLYQLGKTHFALKEYQHARAAFDHALGSIQVMNGVPVGRKGPLAPQAFADLVVTSAYTLINLDQPTEALHRLQAHQENIARSGPGSADFCHCLGYIHLIQDHLDLAQAAFEAAIVCGQAGESVSGTGTFRSLYHLGLIAEARADHAAAEQYYTQSLMAKPDYQPTIARCIDRIVEQRRPLPPGLWRVCDTGAFTDAYLTKLRQLNPPHTLVLLEAARLICPDLYTRCLELPDESTESIRSTMSIPQKR